VNHETKLVMLWIHNSESVHNFFINAARNIYNRAKPTTYGNKYEVAKYELADYMKDKLGDEMYNLLEVSNISGLWADLLSSAFQDVEWNIIAENYLEDFATETVDT
jgi:hypothetical protein